MFRSASLLLALSALPVPTPTGQEPLRPQIHFSPREHWMNDPNGLVYFEGEYHLFFQFNPFGDTPGHISWGHAVSPDLLHWRELPVAIPATPAELVFTGSVVVDEHNTSGLCAAGHPCLVAIYTAHHDADASSPRIEAQSLAVSQDRGRTWTRFAGNPVLDLQLPEFRDPSVSWSDVTHSWLMAVSLPNDHQVVFFTSPNLKQWTRLSAFGPAGSVAGQWECPDLLYVPPASGRGSGIWALKVGLNPGSLQGGSGEQYFLGTFDAHGFRPSDRPGAHGWTDFGKDSYCAISYNHLPPGHAPTLIGWMDNWQYADKLPTSPWRGQMTLPRLVTFVSDAAGLTLKQDPVVAPLRVGAANPFPTTLHPGARPVFLLTNKVPLEVQVAFQPHDAESFGIRIFSDDRHFVEVGYDVASAQVYVDRTHAQDTAPEHFAARTSAPYAPTRPFDLHLILDRSSVEVFAQQGTVAMTNLVLPQTTAAAVQLFRQGGSQEVKVDGTSWTLGSTIR